LPACSFDNSVNTSRILRGRKFFGKARNKNFPCQLLIAAIIARLKTNPGAARIALYLRRRAGQFEPTSNHMGRLSIIKEFLEFLRERKKWWIAPIVLFLLVLGGLLIFAKGSALAPFIYSLF
jgi:hypothetical protein